MKCQDCPVVEALKLVRANAELYERTQAAVDKALSSLPASCDGYAEGVEACASAITEAMMRTTVLIEHGDMTKGIYLGVVDTVRRSLLPVPSTSKAASDDGGEAERFRTALHIIRAETTDALNNDYADRKAVERANSVADGALRECGECRGDHIGDEGEWAKDREIIEKWRRAPLQREGEHVLDDTRRNREMKECTEAAFARWPAALDEIASLRALREAEPSDEEVERVARVLHETTAYRWGGPPWERLLDTVKEDRRTEARAVLKARR